MFINLLFFLKKTVIPKKKKKIEEIYLDAKYATSWSVSVLRTSKSL